MCQDCVAFTCSCPMEGKPGEGPEAMDVTLICPAIWPMLLVAMLEAIETLRLMPLPLYMLPLFCWVNCGDACCCENMLWRGKEDQKSQVKTNILRWEQRCFRPLLSLLLALLFEMILTSKKCAAVATIIPCHATNHVINNLNLSPW